MIYTRLAELRAEKLKKNLPPLTKAYLGRKQWNEMKKDNQVHWQATTTDDDALGDLKVYGMEIVLVRRDDYLEVA